MTIREAKQVTTITSAWQLLNLPGKPGKSCKAPHREDRSPSFSVYDEGRKFNDFGTGEKGDVVAFLSVVLGISNSDACKELLKISSSQGPLPKIKTSRKSASLAKQREVNYYRQLRKGGRHELFELAELRGIGFDGIKLTQERGHLRFSLDKQGLIWSLADPCGIFRQDRMLSGKPIKLKNGDPVKARTLGRLEHPLGLQEIERYKCVLVVEGGPDFLAANHLITLTNDTRHYGVIGMLGASQGFTSEQAKMLEGKRIRIFPHMDAAGLKGAKVWDHSLRSHGVETDIYDFGDIRTEDDKPVKDLNDLLRVNVDDWENDPLIRMPLLGLIARGEQ